MLVVKVGLDVHIDYVLNHYGVNGAVKNTRAFYLNKIPDDRIHSIGLQEVCHTFDFGLALASKVDASQTGAFMPLHNVSIKNRNFTNEIEKLKKTILITSTITVSTKNFKVPEGGIVLGEFGIRGLSRISIYQPEIGLKGIEIQEGEWVDVTITFNYTYYTNDLVTIIDDDIFGKALECTSEVMTLPRFPLDSLNNSRGYGAGNFINLYPITTDIRNKPTKDIIPPTHNPLQDTAQDVDYMGCRADVYVLGYTEVDTNVYGFILRDNSRGVGVLLRFSQPVRLAKESRYAVAGYLTWRGSRDLDNGYRVLEFDDVVEKVNMSMTIDNIAIERPIPKNDVGVAINALEQLQMILPDGTTLSVQNGDDLVAVKALFKQHGFDVELVSNRQDLNQPSTHTYTAPNAQAYKSVLDAHFDDKNNILPLMVVGGNYIDNVGLTSNSWRWDLYHPYFAQDVSYIGFLQLSAAKAANTLKLVTAALQDPPVTAVNKISNVRLVETNTVYKASELLALHQNTDNGLIYTLVDELTGVVDPNLTNNGNTYTVTSDYDTSAYADWIRGVTSVQLNHQFLNLIPDAVESQGDVTTEVVFTIDSTRHDPEHIDVWIGSKYIGVFNAETLNELRNGYGIEYTSVVAGTKTTYTLSKPYLTNSTMSEELYVLANGKALFDTREAAYFRVVNGKKGFKVFNKSGSDITASLYPTDNAFMALGVRLTQPLPAYLFRYKLLTASEASRILNYNVLEVLPDSLFTLNFENSIFSVTYAGLLDYKSPYLNNLYAYPALGIDMSMVEDLVDLDDVIFVDTKGVSWTKRNILEDKLVNPNRWIGDIFYSDVVPFKLIEGVNSTSKSMLSQYYKSRIDLQVNTNVQITYSIESAYIEPQRREIEKGEIGDFIVKVIPEQAVIEDVVWSIIDTNIAQIDQSGVVVAKEVGVTTVRAVVNGKHSATAEVSVYDNALVISCDLATNPTARLLIDDGEYELIINDEVKATTITDEALRTDFADSISATTTIVLDNPLDDMLNSDVDQTNLFDLEGLHDLWIGGTLIGKQLTKEQIITALNEDPRLVLQIGVEPPTLELEDLTVLSPTLELEDLTVLPPINLKLNQQ